MRLATLCEAYRDNHIDLKQNSYALYEIAERQFSRWLGRPAELSDLTKANLVAWMRSLRESGRSGVTVNNKRNHVLALWNFAADEGLFSPPPRKLPKASEERPLPNSWSTPQLESILAAAANAPERSGWGPNEWTALVRTAYDTAARIGALLKVKANAYDHATHRLQLAAGIQKGGQTTTHQVSDETHAAVSAMLDERRADAGGRLFAWPFRPDHIWRAYRRDILRPAGLSSSRRDLFHRIRRTSYSHVAAVQGIDAATRHAGHQSDLSRFYLDPAHMPQPSPLDALPRLTVQRA